MSEATKFIFVRHGETDQNLDMAAGRAAKLFDYPLNATGVQQVAEARDKLASEDVDVIISSPLLRAKMTAEGINEKHGVPLVVEQDLRERAAGGVAMPLWHELFDMDKNVTPDGQNTETVKEFFERVYAVIDRLVEKYTGKTVLVVAHGGVNQAFYAYFNHLPWAGNMRVDVMQNADVRYYEAGKGGR